MIVRSPNVQPAEPGLPLVRRQRRIALAWHNLLHEKQRTITAVCGISFAIVLIFMQLGFYGSVLTTATALYDELDYDVLLCAHDYSVFSRPGTLPREKLYQALGVDGVESAAPLHVSFSLWKNDGTGKRQGILVIGFETARPPFRRAIVREMLRRLEQPDSVLYDTNSRPEFGRHALGDRIEVGARTIEIVGHFAVELGFSADGCIAVSEENFQRLIPGRDGKVVSLALLKLRAGADPVTTAERLNAALGASIRAMPRAAMDRRERDHWVTATPVGIVFGMGAAVAFIVGVIVVYQILSSDIIKHFAEYATLRAMGYPGSYLSGLVFQQAMILAVLGYAPSFLLTLLLYAATAYAAHIPMTMTAWRAMSVFASTLLMCGFSAYVSVAKAKTSDPADLFQ